METIITKTIQNAMLAMEEQLSEDSEEEDDEEDPFLEENQNLMQETGNLEIRIPRQ